MLIRREIEAGCTGARRRAWASDIAALGAPAIGNSAVVHFNACGFHSSVSKVAAADNRKRAIVYAVLSAAAVCREAFVRVEARLAVQIEKVAGVTGARAGTRASVLAVLRASAVGCFAVVDRSARCLVDVEGVSSVAVAGARGRSGHVAVHSASTVIRGAVVDCSAALLVSIEHVAGIARARYWPGPCIIANLLTASIRRRAAGASLAVAVVPAIASTCELHTWGPLAGAVAVGVAL